MVGENGSGKSTLIKGLLGLIPEGSGQVNYGKEISNHVIGYLPQQTSSQKDFPATVWEVILSGCLSTRKGRFFYSKEDKEKARRQMRHLELENLASRSFGELSGGQQQRVLLARALCATQKMLLVDEPVSGLDPKATAQMYELLEELNEIDGITIIMISHDIASAMKYASHILRVGKHTFFGTRDEYLEEYRRRKAYRRMIQKREAQKEEGEWQ